MREERAEVLVIGAGPAGLAAAAAASEQGAEVLLVDENPFAGGQIWRPARGAGPRAETASLLERSARARRLLGAVVFDADAPAPAALSSADSSGESAGAPSPRRLRALAASDDASGNEVVELVASRVVLALGATERFLPFPGWTLPGVLGVGGLQAMVEGGMEVREQRVAIAGSGPLLLAVAASLLDAGARVVGVFEQAPRAAVLRFGASLVRHPRKLAQAIGLLAGLRRVRRVHSSWPVCAEGEGAIERVTVRRAAKRAVREETIEIDLLACAFGLAPATGLASMLGCEVRGGRVVIDELQRTTVPNVLCAGESTGIGGVDLALAEGEVAGCAAAGRLDAARAASHRVRSERRFADALGRAFALRPELRELPRDDTVVCRCEDTPWGAIRARRDARQAKLETRCGMGPCQGRVCGPALEVLCGWEREHPRPPLIPVPFDALAVCRSHPEPFGARRDPMSPRRHPTLPGDQR